MFVIYKIPHLFVPLFWDEMGVYGKSIFYLLDNKIGFLPNYLDPELSRGHPMLYVFLVAAFSKLFGSSVFSMHLFSLLVSVATLFSIYYISKNLFSKRVGLFALIILISQALFIAQSILVLPEILLAFFMLWTVYFFLNERWFMYFLFGSFAILTKETAVFIPFVFGFVFLFRKIFFSKTKECKNIIYIFLPILSFAFFLFIQKFQNGWFFFPYHNPFQGDNNFLNINKIIIKGQDFLNVILWEQGRILISIASLALLMYSFFQWNKKTQYQVIVLVLVVLGLVLFSSTNHFMKRYMLFALYLTSIVYALALSQIFKNKFLLPLGIVAILLSLCVKNVDTNSFSYDENMSYLKFVNFQKDLTHFLENQEEWNDSTIITSNFPISLSFEDKRYGYSKRRAKVCVYNKINNDSHFIIEIKPGNSKQFKIPKYYKKIDFPSQNFSSVKIYKKKE